MSRLCRRCPEARVTNGVDPYSETFCIPAKAWVHFNEPCRGGSTEGGRRDEQIARDLGLSLEVTRGILRCVHDTDRMITKPDPCESCPLLSYCTSSAIGGPNRV